MKRSMFGFGLCFSIFSCISLGARADFVGNVGTDLDLAGLKAKCAELSGNQQLKPFNAVISCSSKTTFWKVVTFDKNPKFKMKNTHEYGVAARMKGYQMPYQVIPTPIGPTEAPCVVLEKWTATVPAIEVELSCDKLSKLESFVDVCQPLIEKNRKENPSLSIMEKGAQVFNSCEHTSGLTQGQTE